jgi:hypothetical protein
MRGKITVAVLLGAAVVICFCLLQKRPPQRGGPVRPAERVVSVAGSSPAVNSIPAPPAAGPGIPRNEAVARPESGATPQPNSAPGSSLQFTNIPPDAVMDHLRSVFHQYASMFGGNPVGTNPEITASLHGGNPKGADFIDAEAGMRIDAGGNLIDPWGTPYFFHQLSGQEMEIHCAGPDRKMWTADDLVIK